MSSRTRTELVWVRYNPRSATLLLSGLTWEAELAHRRLCDFIWSGAPWPAPDFAKAGMLARVPSERWDAVLQELQTVGWRIRKDQLYHADVAAVRGDSLALFRANQARCKAASKARWPENKGSVGPAPRTPSRPPLRSPSTVCKPYKTEPYKAVNSAERLTLSSEPPKMGDDRENQFLEDLQNTLTTFSPKAASGESKNWGGWWRNRYRENPDKARRVLAEVASMIKEGRIKRNPGAAGLDLWNRLP